MPVWHCVEGPLGIYLNNLHQVIQCLMIWKGYHLYSSHLG